MKTQILTLVAICMTAMAFTQNLSDSLIAHFPLNGNGLDIEGGLSPVNVEGNPIDTTDRFGNSGEAIWLDGASFYSYGDVLDMDTSSFSISLWAFVESVNPGASATYMVSNGTTVYGTPPIGYAAGVRHVSGASLTTTCGIRENTNSYTVEDSISYQNWHHIIYSHCDSINRLYVDGSLVDIDTIPSGIIVNNNIFFAIGALDRDPTNESDVGFYHGALDDIRIYKGRCLSQAEIDTLSHVCETVVHQVDTFSCSPITINDSTYIQSGTDTLQLVDGFGCDSTLIINVEIEALDTSVVFDPDLWTLTAQQDSVSYQWVECGVTTDTLIGENDQTLALTNNGFYAVILSSTNCTIQTECINVTGTGLGELDDSRLAIYPNPATEFVSFSEPVYDKIELIDQQGRMVYNKWEGYWISRIDVSRLSPGIYLLRVHSGIHQTHKISITK